MGIKRVLESLERARKLARLAADTSASQGEQDSARKRLAAHLKKHRIRAEDLVESDQEVGDFYYRWETDAWEILAEDRGLRVVLCDWRSGSVILRGTPKAIWEARRAMLGYRRTWRKHLLSLGLGMAEEYAVSAERHADMVLRNPILADALHERWIGVTSICAPLRDLRDVYAASKRENGVTRPLTRIRKAADLGREYARIIGLRPDPPAHTGFSAAPWRAIFPQEPRLEDLGIPLAPQENRSELELALIDMLLSAQVDRYVTGYRKWVEGPPAPVRALPDLDPKARKSQHTPEALQEWLNQCCALLDTPGDTPRALTPSGYFKSADAYLYLLRWYFLGAVRGEIAARKPKSESGQQEQQDPQQGSGDGSGGAASEAVNKPPPLQGNADVLNLVQRANLTAYHTRCEGEIAVEEVDATELRSPDAVEGQEDPEDLLRRLIMESPTNRGLRLSGPTIP